MGTPRAKVVEFMKPVVLIAGIPMALSAAAFITARTISRNNLISKAATSGTQTESSISKASKSEIQAGSTETSLAPAEEFRDEKSCHSLHSTPYTNSSEYKEIVSIKSEIRELQEREGELEMQFLRYSDLKKQEALLAEFQNMLMSEMVRTEFLGREVSSLQAQNRMIENLGMELLRVVEQHRLSRIKSGLFRMRVKKLSKKIKSQSQIMKEQKLSIKVKDMEILTNREELKSRRNIIKALEGERSELRGIINQLEIEKAQLLNMQDIAETSASSITKDQAKGDYSQLVNELEQVRKEQAAELRELTYLQWSNACLRHELMRDHECQEGNQEQKSPLEQELEGNTKIEENDDEIESMPDKSMLTGSSLGLGIKYSNHECSKRPKLLQKLRSRWAGGRGKVKGKSEDSGKMGLGRQYVSDVIDQHCHARWSCSSV